MSNFVSIRGRKPNAEGYKVGLVGSLRNFIEEKISTAILDYFLKLIVYAPNTQIYASADFKKGFSTWFARASKEQWCTNTLPLPKIIEVGESNSPVNVPELVPDLDELVVFPVRGYHTEIEMETFKKKEGRLITVFETDETQVTLYGKEYYSHTRAALNSIERKILTDFGRLERSSLDKVDVLSLYNVRHIIPVEVALSDLLYAQSAVPEILLYVTYVEDETYSPLYCNLQLRKSFEKMPCTSISIPGVAAWYGGINIATFTDVAKSFVRSTVIHHLLDCSDDSSDDIEINISTNCHNFWSFYSQIAATLSSLFVVLPRLAAIPGRKRDNFINKYESELRKERKIPSLWSDFECSAYHDMFRSGIVEQWR